jgi:LysM repeat protein
MGLILDIQPNRSGHVARPYVGKKMTTHIADVTMNFKYKPDSTEKSTKVVFIQVMRELLDGKVLLPSKIDPSFSYQDADSTPTDLYHVDFVSGEKDPYYNGDDAGLDFGPQGKAAQFKGDTIVEASTSDTPTFNDSSFPTGSSTLKWEFRTAAFSAAGSDAGTYYQYARWDYIKEKGKKSKLVIGDGGIVPGPKFRAAVDLWCKNHGFKLPTPTPPTPPTPIKPGTTYVVKSGDWLSKIAQACYGDPNQWKKIYDANKAVIGPDPNRIFPGQVLTLPV